MKLYHGSGVVVRKPRILPPMPGRTLDFGTGFYAATDFEQAKRWISIRMRREDAQNGFVSIFDFDSEILQSPGMRYLSFPSATPEWLDFVMANRSGTIDGHDYDIVSGPFANDRVYATLTLFETGQLDAAETIHRLKTYKLVDQFLFHTENALKHLHFAGSEAVNVHE